MRVTLARDLPLLAACRARAEDAPAFPAQGAASARVRAINAAASLGFEAPQRVCSGAGSAQRTLTELPEPTDAPGLPAFAGQAPQPRHASAV